MTKNEAEKQGFCGHCAAYSYGHPLCGALVHGEEKQLCQLDLETQERWKQEFGVNQDGTIKG